jgi:hypothetical protein
MESLRFSAAIALTALALLVVAPAPLLADDPPAEGPAVGEWVVTSGLNITLTQNAYSENWAGGESGALSWALNSNSLAESQLNPALHSKTALRLAFGQTHSQDRETKVWARPVKSTDLVDFESILRLTRGWVVDPFASGHVETQFVDERDAAETRFFNPVLYTESVGVARSFIKDEKREWSVRLGGALRQHVDGNVLSEESGKQETVTTSDGGVEFVSEFRTPMAGEKITLASDLTVFQALFNSEEDELAGVPGADDWKSPDVNWENTFTANITNHLMVNLYVQLLYDKEIDADVRLKETLSLGFTFQIM